MVVRCLPVTEGTRNVDDRRGCDWHSDQRLGRHDWTSAQGLSPQKWLDNSFCQISDRAAAVDQRRAPTELVRRTATPQSVWGRPTRTRYTELRLIVARKVE
jgi:hypothetical protein